MFAKNTFFRQKSGFLQGDRFMGRNDMADLLLESPVCSGALRRPRTVVSHFQVSAALGFCGLGGGLPGPVIGRPLQGCIRFAGCIPFAGESRVCRDPGTTGWPVRVPAALLRSGFPFPRPGSSAKFDRLPDPVRHSARPPGFPVRTTHRRKP